MTTQVTLDWIVVPYARTAAQLTSFIASSVVPLDPSYGILTSTTTTSDVTSVAGGKARRRIIQNLTQPPIQIAPTNTLATVQYTPSVFSTSPNDTLAGSGAQTIQLQYNDATGAPQTENINLNGKTPVSSAMANYFRLTGFTIISAGADLANDGVIWVTVPTAALTGAPASKVPGTTYLAVVDQGFYKKNPGGLATWPRVFQNWLGGALKAAVGPVVEAAPVFA